MHEMATKKKNKRSKKGKDRRTGKSSNLSEPPSREEIKLRKSQAKLEQSRVRNKRLKQAQANIFLSLRIACISGMAAIGMVLFVVIIFCAVFDSAKVANLVTAFQVLTGGASLFVGVWALILSIRAERTSSLSPGRQYAINYSQIPEGLKPRQDDFDINND